MTFPQNVIKTVPARLSVMVAYLNVGKKHESVAEQNVDAQVAVGTGLDGLAENESQNAQ